MVLIKAYRFLILHKKILLSVAKILLFPDITKKIIDELGADYADYTDFLFFRVVRVIRA